MQYRDCLGQQGMLPLSSVHGLMTISGCYRGTNQTILKENKFDINVPRATWSSNHASQSIV